MTFFYVFIKSYTNPLSLSIWRVFVPNAKYWGTFRHECKQTPLKHKCFKYPSYFCYDCTWILRDK